MNTYAWLHKSGLWLRVSLSTAFGFNKVESGQTSDVHEAYIGVELPEFTDDTQVSEYTAVPAWVERRVFIGTPAAPVLSTTPPKPQWLHTDLSVLGLSKTLHNRLYKAGYMTVESILNTGSAKLLQTTPLSKPQYRELYTVLGNHDYDVRAFTRGTA